MTRLPLAAAVLLTVTLGAVPPRAAAPADDAAAREAPPAAQPADAKNGNPANGMPVPSGAQVLPLPAPDASTARGQERGNAALKANENPSQSGSSEEGQRSGSDK